MKRNISVFTTAYLPPIQYLAHFINADNPVVEQHDNYLRQTYRNRCDIIAANGTIPLTIPVTKGRGPKVKIQDLEISYDERWQKLHWRSIVSAYNSSPFFEYYMDDFMPFYEKQYKFLFDFNMELLQTIWDVLDYPIEIKLTEEYISRKTEGVTDYRDIIHPKKDFKAFDSSFKVLEYRQVFQDRFEFKPNLSVIDLLFNKGPEAIDYLEDSIEKE